MRINFSGTLQRCQVCHDWIVLSPGQHPDAVCPYCGANQDLPQGPDGGSLKGRTKSRGDEVGGGDAALISLRLQQFRIRNGLAADHRDEAAREQTVPGAGTTTGGDPYPDPDGDFSPTLKDYLNDHVLMGNVVVVAADVASAAFGWFSSAGLGVLGVLVGAVAAGTIVDTWVHKFFH
ncbi:MAG: hypothetical protein ABSF83_00340 [Nitrososphaerales archaeon]|jgi:hypothetical protein